ncbi:hypothetical protein M3629_05840 [Paenibacillus polysaccharolyticus]|uniref:hypothetical protein n=1 Tax=Paenibacillus polysaccharolyticus TaxID=582692 RepID=UPI002041F3FE|nr:hypothetical protein [Paenibacillus polysaccharolyticus]MCM3132297.1 hypothetical protein [Paenibacillus polysaccharolyticus]
MNQFGQQIWGSVELGSEINIDTDNNTFAFDVDGLRYSLAIPTGKYITSRKRHESELVQIMTKTAEQLNLPVQFRLGGIHNDQKFNVLILEHLDKDKEYLLDEFGGSAVDTVFGEVRFNLAPRN